MINISSIQGAPYRTKNNWEKTCSRSSLQAAGMLLSNVSGKYTKENLKVLGKAVYKKTDTNFSNKIL